MELQQEERGKKRRKSRWLHWREAPRLRSMVKPSCARRRNPGSEEQVWEEDALYARAQGRFLASLTPIRGLGQNRSKDKIDSVWSTEQKDDPSLPLQASISPRTLG